ncbi:hypothetical protein Tco_0843992, partial [Tanacetum coccineum]
VLKVQKNSLEALKVLKNNLEALKVLKNNLEVLNVLQSNLELQENSSIHEAEASKFLSKQLIFFSWQHRNSRTHIIDMRCQPKGSVSLALQKYKLKTSDQVVDWAEACRQLFTQEKIFHELDLNDQKTAKLTGDNNRDFRGFISNEIERSVPFCYESWEVVPDKYKGTLWPAIHTYFDMAPYLSGPNAKQVEKGMEAQFKSQYRNRKNKFKDEMFVERGFLWGDKEPVQDYETFLQVGRSIKEWQS